MELTEHQYKQIRDFVAGRMSAEEGADFEKEIIDNELLRQRLDFELELEEYVKWQIGEDDEVGKLLAQAERDTTNEETKTIREQIEAAGKLWKKNTDEESVLASKKASGEQVKPNINPMPEMAKVKPMQAKLVWLAAAGCLIALLAIWIVKPWQGKKRNPSVTHENAIDSLSDVNNIVHNNIDTAEKSQNPVLIKLTARQLYKQFYKKDSLPNIDERPQYLKPAFEALDTGNYMALLSLPLNDESITSFRGAAIESKDNVKTLGHYYKGTALLETGEVEKAIAEFSWVMNEVSSPIWKERATWYLAMAYLRKDNYIKAKSLLEILAKGKGNSDLSNTAKAILSTPL